MEKEYEKISFKIVQIPHLRVTVCFLDLSKLKGIEVQGTGYTTIFNEDEDMHLTIGVFYENIEENINKIECMPLIFHEIIHALQYICERRGIDMEEEKEHMGYMASFLTEKLLGLYPQPITNK